MYVESELTAERWLASLKAGHAFVTHGPMIRFIANEKAIPGTTLELKAGESVRFRADLQSVTPLKRAVLIKDGEVLRTFDLEGMETTIEFTDTPEVKTWYVLRVYAEDGDQALTNPIWVSFR